ncbi:MBL fold metallo-hydrolase [Hufsiella ginkgonis]|uniref:MBL fold metallo-hydrolase n=1 Tax=Hufsiella ginkgonis TaxID=2695274 RepID=A0A7K1XZ03_9SPHI|nr:MBL fold metallo-hydrolase [Hufsiella ginkgonis]MXV16235.1 MBL fold metallo-hydrolase [Hufsiella ginkgonis]
MKVTFLGTGTSQGVPVIACECEVCMSPDPHNKRLRVSVLVEVDGKNIVIDSGPDFRYQMLRQGVKHLEGIMITHEHKDHIAGLDDIRAFNYKQQSALDVYATERVQRMLRNEFHYAFAESKYPGIPLINLVEISNEPFTVAGIRVIPIEVMHHKLPVSGFRFGDFTYITDAKTVSESEREKIKGSQVLVVNALQHDFHISHFTFREAIEFAQSTGVPSVYFTHISHKLGKHDEVSAMLPAGIRLAYDGLQIDL